MAKSSSLLAAPHLDIEGFRAAIEYTSRVTGFRMDLIEKDYFCSIALTYLFAQETPLVFKGGTCLNKIHVGFYRLSEGLDFSIPMNFDATRGERRRAIEPVKRQLGSIEKLATAFQLTGELAGHNEGRHYAATMNHQSSITSKMGLIKLEVGLREPLFDLGQRVPAHALVMDPFKKTELLSPVITSCLSLREAFSEKIRAALTRKDPAIRDLFDLDYAIRHQKIDILDEQLINYTRSKLRIPGTNATDVSASRIDAMRWQLTTELQPVLRQDDYVAFDFDRAVSRLEEIARNFSKM